MLRSLVGSEMCIRDRPLSNRHVATDAASTQQETIRINTSEIELPNSSHNSLLHETAKVVSFLHNDLARICRIDPTKHTTAESNCLALFLKLAKSVKQLKVEQGDPQAAVECVEFGEEVVAGTSPRPMAWEERPYHNDHWKPPEQFYGVNNVDPQSLDGWNTAVEEVRTMRYNLKRSGKAQVSVKPPSRLGPRGTGGPFHNFESAHPTLNNPRGKDCFKRAEAPDNLMESVSATLAELRDQERSIVCKERRDKEEEEADPVLEDERWYQSKGPEFGDQMSIYMKSLESANKWSAKDEQQLQQAMSKVGLDLSKKTADVMKRPNARTHSRTKW
eukprot:TRINITY_DN37709_c0_g1_i1.p1 TRINITY_DN37709_c0_g1~~TRINITY_DN37709_c0_g1_i1.p1  ORF type:complete len:362 (+),score=99.45 TRINITY_DN37709_c0_g1_i1:92-1087(+)